LPDVIVPFIDKTYPTIAKPEGRLLVGFSKSGLGAVSLLLRHPDVFGRAGAWDSPLIMDNRPEFYGSNEFYKANYYLPTLLNNRRKTFQDQPARIAITGYCIPSCQRSNEDFHKLLDKLDVPHYFDNSTRRDHVWHSGWLAPLVDVLMAADMAKVPAPAPALLEEKKQDAPEDDRARLNRTLKEAAGRGDTAKVLDLIKQGADVGWRDPADNGKTPLVKAIFSKKLDTVKALVENGASVNDPDGSNRHPMYFTHVSTVEIMEYVISKGGNKEINRYAGATEKNPKGIGKTVLGSVCSYGLGSPEMIGVLVKAGADPNQPYLIDKSTPLIEAILKQRPGYDNAKYVKALLENKADVNRKDPQGRTPLQVAKTKGNKEVIELLEKAGARE
jgi:hypothetical protein